MRNGTLLGSTGAGAMEVNKMLELPLRTDLQLRDSTEICHKNEILMRAVAWASDNNGLESLTMSTGRARTERTNGRLRHTHVSVCMF